VIVYAKKLGDYSGLRFEVLKIREVYFGWSWSVPFRSVWFINYVIIKTASFLDIKYTDWAFVII